jgi:hypothetical protein
MAIYKFYWQPNRLFPRHLETPAESVERPLSHRETTIQERRNPARQRRLPAHLEVADVRIHLMEEDFGYIDEIYAVDIEIFAYKRQPSFADSRAQEMNGLMERSVFEIVPITAIPAGIRLFTSRFVDEIKHPGTPEAYEKSRLVVRAFKDVGKEDILVESPTIQRSS